MPDLSPLHPTDGSPGAIAAAIARCTIAGRAALAEIERLKAERVTLLACGQAADLKRNLTELTEAMAAATEIGEILDQLNQASAAGTPNEPTPHAAALQAAADLAGWWRANGPVVVGGLTLFASSIAGIITAIKAAAPATRPDNVAPFPPRPVA